MVWKAIEWARTCLGKFLLKFWKWRVVHFEKMHVSYVFVTCDCFFDKIISTGRRIHIFNRSVTKEKTVLDYYKSPCKRLNAYCAITIVFIWEVDVIYISSHNIQRETFCNRLAHICDSFDYQNFLRKSRFKKVHFSPYKIYPIVKY